MNTMISKIQNQSCSSKPKCRLFCFSLLALLGCFVDGSGAIQMYSPRKLDPVELRSEEEGNITTQQPDATILPSLEAEIAKRQFSEDPSRWFTFHAFGGGSFGTVGEIAFIEKDSDSNIVTALGNLHSYVPVGDRETLYNSADDFVLKVTSTSDFCARTGHALFGTQYIRQYCQHNLGDKMVKESSFGELFNNNRNDDPMRDWWSATNSEHELSALNRPFSFGEAPEAWVPKWRRSRSSGHYTAIILEGAGTQNLSSWLETSSADLFVPYINQEREGSVASAVENMVTSLESSVEKIHSRGLMHGDLKPQNTVVGTNDDGTQPHLTIVDFDSLLHPGSHKPVVTTANYFPFHWFGYRVIHGEDGFFVNLPFPSPVDVGRPDLLSNGSAGSSGSSMVRLSSDEFKPKYFQQMDDYAVGMISLDILRAWILPRIDPRYYYFFTEMSDDGIYDTSSWSRLLEGFKKRRKHVEESLKKWIALAKNNPADQFAYKIAGWEIIQPILKKLVVKISKWMAKPKDIVIDDLQAPDAAAATQGAADLEEISFGVTSPKAAPQAINTTILSMPPSSQPQQGRTSTRWSRVVDMGRAVTRRLPSVPKFPSLRRN